MPDVAGEGALTSRTAIDRHAVQQLTLEFEETAHVSNVLCGLIMQQVVFALDVQTWEMFPTGPTDTDIGWHVCIPLFCQYVFSGTCQLVCRMLTAGCTSRSRPAWLLGCYLASACRVLCFVWACKVQMNLKAKCASLKHISNGHALLSTACTRHATAQGVESRIQDMTACMIGVHCGWQM